MKVYLVYHYTALEFAENLFEPSSIVVYTTDSLTDAICFMEEEDTSNDSWWKVESFELGKKDKTDDAWNEHHVGWYTHKVIRIEFSPFFNIIERIFKERGIGEH